LGSIVSSAEDFISPGNKGKSSPFVSFDPKIISFIGVVVRGMGVVDKDVELAKVVVSLN
jgi:hypothetical protein